MSDLYDDDILAWSEHQSELLRRRAAGEPVNEQIDREPPLPVPAACPATLDELLADE